MGSGFIISTDGYLLTNNHVVEGADEIVVHLQDRQEFDATIVGTDPRSDLALLKIEAQDLPAVALAQPDQLKVGEWVLAIGSPFGLDYSVSAGIVSAIGRSVPNGEQGNYVPFIQTDVAINPGNSGGPLFNLSGEVVGINSQIYTTSGGSVGLSFAIPVGLAMDVVEQLKATGSVDRGWLGVGIQDVDKDLAESFDLDKPVGALVSYVEEDGPADDGGVRVGDVIVKFDGNDIVTSDELPHFVGLTRPGSEAALEVIRDGKSKTLEVEVGSLDGGAKQAKSKQSLDQSEKLGLVLEELEEAAAQRFRLAAGVVVVDVVPGSYAAQSFLRPGDVITMVGGRNIDSVADFEKVVSDLPAGRRVPLRIVRRGQAGFVAIQIPR
jgi:serine protease Do